MLLFSNFKNIKLIQIGANDGKDLLNEFNNDYREKITLCWYRTIKSYFFNKLKRNL